MESNAIARWVADRAWSRAGAVALAMSSGTPRRAVVFSARVALLVGGSIAIAVAVAAMLWNSFGPGPLDVFIVGLRELTGLPITLAYWSAFAIMLALAALLGRRPGFGTIITPLILGPTVQVMVSVFDRLATPGSLWLHLVVHVAAIGLAGVGAGALIVSGLGAGTGELLAAAASDRTGRPEPHVRFGFEMGWLLLGIGLGGPIGLGTLVVACLIGPAVANGRRLVDRLVSTPRLHTATRVPVGAGVH